MQGKSWTDTSPRLNDGSTSGLSGYLAPGDASTTSLVSAYFEERTLSCIRHFAGPVLPAS